MFQLLGICCCMELTVSWMIKAVSGVALCAALTSSWLKSRRKWSLLARLPGPKPKLFIGNLLEFYFCKRGMNMELINMAKKYEGLFVIYLGRKPLVIITDPEYLKTFFTSSTMLDRSDSYRFIADTIGHGIFVAGGARWKQLRKMVTINFNNTPIGIMLKNFLDASKSMLAGMRKEADGAVFKSYNLLQMATLSASTLNLAGGKQTHSAQLEVLQNFNFLMKTAAQRNFNPLLSSNFIFSLTSRGRQFWRRKQRVFQGIDEDIDKIAVKSRELKIRGEPLPDLYMYNMLKNHGEEPKELIVGELVTLTGASLETTAATVGFALTMFGLFPEVQEKVYQEDQEVHRRLQGRELEIDDMQHYAYLERAIKETMRLFPITPFTGRKLTEDTYIGKFLIPKGTDVINLQAYTFRNPKFFPEPLTFNPDRFLPENLDKIPPYAFTPFSAGPRICPGMRSAYIAMKVYLSSIVREFRVISQYTSLSEALRNTSGSITLKDKQDFPIRLETRAK